MLFTPNIILLGSPGSGKGTQAKILQEKMSYNHISTGDLVRSEIDSQSSLGTKIKGIVDSGDFPDDEIIINLLKKCLIKGSKKCIFDGFPRTKDQAVFLLGLLSDLASKEPIYTFYISVPDAVVINRLTKRYMCANCGSIYSDDIPLKNSGVCNSCGSSSFLRREDDKEVAVKKRLDVYYKKTKPLFDFLKEKTSFFQVNGDQPASLLTKEIVNILRQGPEII